MLGEDCENCGRNLNKEVDVSYCQSCFNDLEERIEDLESDNDSMVSQLEDSERNNDYLVEESERLKEQIDILRNLEGQNKE